MAKRRGKTNGSNPRLAGRAGGTGNAIPAELDAASGSDAGIPPAGTDKPDDGPTMDATPLMAGSDGINHTAQSEGVSDGGDEKTQNAGLETGETATPGAAEDGADTTGAKDNVSGSQSHASGADLASGTDQQANGDSNDASKPSVGDGSADTDGDGNVASSAGSDLKEALELAGCESSDQLIDMARVGSSLLEKIDDLVKLEGPFKHWSPMDDPAEIVGDLYAALEHAKEQIAVPVPLVIPEKKEDEQPSCPICAEPFKPTDLCATDIEAGTCHAACLEGSPVVDLSSGEPFDGPIHTFLYVDDFLDELERSIFNAACIVRDFAWDSADDIALHFAGKPYDPDEVKYTQFQTNVAIDKELVEFTRRLGRATTPDILATQLMITKHRRTADLTMPERIALQAFITVLLDLDEYAAAERKRIDAEVAEKPTPRPLPIEDTTMELVDDHDATW